MKWSFAAVGTIMMGIFGILIIMLFNDITVSNEQDYFNLKDVTEAAMIDAVDVAYYRLTGEVKISQEKFVENFTRRFVEVSTFGAGNYGIEFYQISEYPAKVSVRIVDKTSSYNIYTYSSDVEATQATIVNQISAILDRQNEPKTLEQDILVDEDDDNSPPKAYTVRYNPNPPSGKNPKGYMPTSTAIYGKEFITACNTYTVEGYIFNGWNEKADGTGVAWKLTSYGMCESGKTWKWQGENYKKGITLYAQWIKDGNSGSSNGVCCAYPTNQNSCPYGGQYVSGECYTQFSSSCDWTIGGIREVKKGKC